MGVGLDGGRDRKNGEGRRGKWEYKERVQKENWSLKDKSLLVVSKI